MSVVRALVKACHPEPTAAVTAIATMLGYAAGARTTWVAAAFLSGQLTTGWTNDWVDRDRDLSGGRLDKPVAGGEVAPATVGRAALVAGAACVPLSLAMGLAAGLLHLAAVASAAAYNVGLKSTMASFAPYAVSFGLVPSIVTLSAGTGFAPGWATAAGAMLGVGAHLLNVLPDLAADVATGVYGLPHRLGRPASTLTAAVLLLGATVVLAIGPGSPGRSAVAVVGLASAITGVGLVLGQRPGSRAAFLAAIAVALVDVALLVARGTALR